MLSIYKNCETFYKTINCGYKIVIGFYKTTEQSLYLLNCYCFTKECVLFMLFLVTDGGIHTADYLWTHGVRPKSITFNRDQLLEDITYGDEETDIVLFVVHGCTTIRLGEVYVIIEELLNAANIKDFVVMSNIPLSTKRFKPPIQYHYYEGDIMGKDIYLRRSDDYTGASMVKVKEHPLKQFMNESVSEKDVDMQLVERRYLEAEPDGVALSDIYRARLFKDKD